MIGDVRGSRPGVPYLLYRRIALLGLCAANVLSWGAAADGTSVLQRNRAAMERMMSGMAVESTGDADRDFASLMIPHHQGAIDMAQTEILYGKNERLRRIAQEIIVDQQQEIVAMQQALAPVEKTDRP